jgi:Domain of unknown function (DUF4336)
MVEQGATGFPIEWGAGIWTVDGGTVPFLTIPYPTRMTVVALGQGALMVISPISPEATDFHALGKLGRVAHLVAPNKLHHLFLGDWKKRFPDARLYAGPGLARKRSDLPFDAELGETPEPAWSDIVDQTIFGGSFFFDEVVFFHRPSRTLILTDILQRHDPRRYGPTSRFFLWLDGLMASQSGVPRDWRLTVTDRKRARRAFETMVNWGPERIIIAHGACVTGNAVDLLRDAFAWLR